MRMLLLGLTLIGQLAIAENLQDVIYKKDGSVLRGSLIEQDFTNGTYKIQLMGGSVFNITKDEIEKITKEAPFNSTATNQPGININVENNPSINQTPQITQAPQVTQTALQPTYNYAPEEASSYKHVYSIGKFSKDFTNDDDNGYRYEGFSLAYQYNFDKNFAFYAEHSRAKLDSFIEDGDYYDSDNPYNQKYRSTRVAAILSSNHYAGWQFYAGLGIFKEKESNSFDEYTANGNTVILGLGYSWEKLQLQFRVGVDDSSDYDSEISGTTANIQLGLNI